MAILGVVWGRGCPGFFVLLVFYFKFCNPEKTGYKLCKSFCGLTCAFSPTLLQGLAPSKLRYSSGAGKPPLIVRQPMKAGSCASSPITPQQSVRAAGFASTVGRVRKLQSSTQHPNSAGGGSLVARSNSMATGAKHALPKSRTSIGGTSSLKSKLAQPAKR